MKKNKQKMGNFKVIAVILALTAMVAGGAARMGSLAGDYIVAVQAAQQAEDSMSGIAGTYYGFVNCRPATLVLHENQRFSMPIQGSENQAQKLAGEYSVVDGTLDLRDEESGREFILAFDGENASMDVGEASMRFSADPDKAAAGMFPVA